MAGRGHSPSLPAGLREWGIDLREQRSGPDSKLRMGDAQHLGLGCTNADERAASRHRAHGAVTVFAAVERVDEDVLDGLRSPGSACGGWDTGAVEGHGRGVKGAAAIDQRLPYTDDHRGARVVDL